LRRLAGAAVKFVGGYVALAADLPGMIHLGGWLFVAVLACLCWRLLRRA